MLIYDETPKNKPERLLRSDLQYLAERIFQLVRLYEKHVFIRDEKTKHTILQLRNYLSLLESERYDILFGDTSFIEDDSFTLEPFDDSNLPV